MKKNLIGLCMAFVLPLCSLAQGLKYQVNLGNTNQDRLQVQVSRFPKQSKLTFAFPKIVPGTYANYDFGRYVSGFEALDANGQPLPIKKLDANSYEISDGKKLDQVRYWVDDTWDSPEIPGPFVFEPAGTEFIKDSLFVLNTHAVFGYVLGQSKAPLELYVEKPPHLYGASSMKNLSNSKTMDHFTLDSYHDLVDAPLLYCRPDTLSFKVANAEVLVSVLSPNKKINAKEIGDRLRPLLELQKNYLGGRLPVDRYAYLLVFADQLHNGSYGALEHAQSSYYYLPEGDIQQMGQTILDVSAHEFFHVVTPLNIHSKEIGDFDFNKPKMSRHLWLYEGLTEYAAHHAQACAKGDASEFMEKFSAKITAMQSQFRQDLSFTKMSQGVLDRYKEEYANVYEKGALLGFGLDLTLRKYSNGSYGTQAMMQDLSKKYGKNQSFNDPQLFKEIVALTGIPEVKDFFKRYVEGKEPLPLGTWLEWIGYQQPQQKEKKMVPSLGFQLQTLSVNPDSKRVIISGEGGINALGKSLGFQAKDELLKAQGLPMDLEHFGKNMGEILGKIQVGQSLNWEIMRKNKNGDYESLSLRAPYQLVEQIQNEDIKPLEQASPAQLRLREQWLGKP